MKKIIFVTAMLLFSSSAYGAGCDCGSVSLIVSRVGTQTVSSVNSNTNMQAQMLKVEINSAARNIIGTLQTQTKSIVSALQLLKEDFHKTIKSTSMAEQLVEIEEIFGSDSQPELLCGGSGLGAGLQIADQASEILKTGLQEKQFEYGNNQNSRPVDFINRIISDEHPSLTEMTTMLSPKNYTLSNDEVSMANESIKTIANPFPLPLPTEEQLGTPAGEGYQTARTIQEGKKGLAMEVLNENVAYHSPTLPSDVTAWATEQWKSSGGTGEVPGLVNGSMSQAGLFALLSQLRSGNPNWIANISKMTNMGVAREQLFIDALNFEIQRRNNELLNKLLVITSLHYLNSIEENNEAKKVYQELISNEQ